MKRAIFKSLEEFAFQYSIIYRENRYFSYDLEEFKNKWEFLLEHPAYTASEVLFL